MNLIAIKGTLTREVCEMFVYKHTKPIEMLKSSLLFKKNKKTLRENNLSIFRIKNAKFSRYYFYMN